MNFVLTHYWTCLRSVFRRPMALVLMVLVALLSFSRLFRDNDLMQVLYIFVIPTFAAAYAKPQALGAKRSGLGEWALAGLPVGFRQRIVAEALVPITFIIAAQALAIALSKDPTSEYVFGTLSNALILVPLLIGGATPARTHLFWSFRGLFWPGIVATCLLIGWLDTPLAKAMMAVCLTALVLVFARFEPSFYRGERIRGKRAEIVARKATSPQRRFTRDLWLDFMRRFGGTMLAGLVAVGVAIALARFGVFSEASLTLPVFLVFAMPMVLMLFSMPFGRPVSESRGGLPLSPQGAWVRVLAPLPLSREFVLRRIYAYSVATAGGIWLVALAVVVYTGLSEQGIGVALASVGFVPLGSGIAISTAAGDRRRWHGCSFAALLYLVVLITVQGVIALSVFFLAALFVGATPWTLLRSPRRLPS